jgi:glyoxylase I family protein
MKFEHFALNVPDAKKVAAWYVKNLGLRVAISREEVPFTSFLADDSGRVILEIYSNTAAAYPDYRASHPLCFHVAFIADDPTGIASHLIASGATAESEDKLPDGSHLVMLRDPWGIPLQLVKRAKAFGTY